MTLYKILLFYLAVVALNARQSESLALKVSPQDCACFPTDKDNIRISKLADTYGEHERKVIYLFKHLDSQNITIYIPNEEKQLNFPDLTINSDESYDLHNMGHLHYIFDYPSDMVTVGEHLKAIATTSNHHEIPHKPTHPAVDNVAISQVPTVQPSVNEKKPDSTVIQHEETGHVLIDVGKYPSHVHPNTESNKLPSTVHEHVKNSVTLVPEHENDHLKPKPALNETEKDSTGPHHGDPGYVVINIIEHPASSVTSVPEHNNDDLKPKPALNETGVDSTGLHHGDPGHVVINIIEQPANSVTLVPEHEKDHHLQPKPSVNEKKTDSTVIQHEETGHVLIDVGKYPSHVHPNTESNKLPSPIHEHDANSVILAPENDNDHLKPKPIVSEIKPEIISHFLVHGKPEYVILPNEKLQPNYIYPNTEGNKRPWPIHEHDTINVIPEHGHEHNYLVIKKTVNEIKVNPSGGTHGKPENVIIDNVNNKPSVHPSRGDNIIVLDVYNKTVNPLDGTLDNIDVIVGPNNEVLSNLNQNPKNVHGEDTNEIVIIPLPPNKIHHSITGKQTVPLSVTTKPKDEDVTSESSIQSQETDYYFIQKVQNLLLEGNDNALLSPVNLKLVNSPVVDRWLIEEINHIIMLGPGTLSLATINLNEIKKHLVYILAQNGLQFSENGYLIDSHGHILQITNLKLRRVMISDPVAYKKHLGGSKCVPPRKIPYLEAVFVSTVHPSKVLGLIPLRISSLPGCREGTCPGRPCTRKHRPVIHHHHPHHPHHRYPTKLNMAPVYNKVLDGRGHYSHYNSVNKHGLLKDLNTLLSPRIGDKEDDKTHHGADADDGLDIRIIGGNPATGSGTPVNSRGR